LGNYVTMHGTKKKKHKIDLIVTESCDETRFVRQLDGFVFCVSDFKFLCELNRGVPPLKVNFYCFVRKIKLNDGTVYVVMGKMTLKQTYCILQMEWWVAEVKKNNNGNEFVHCMWKGSRCPASSCPFLLFFSHVGVLFVRKLVSWLHRSLAGERKRQRAWRVLGGLQPTHTCSALLIFVMRANMDSAFLGCKWSRWMQSG
jgi:hypothetical protein